MIDEPEDFVFDGDEMSVNLDAIRDDPSFLSIVRLTAAKLVENPYITVGSFLKNVSDGDLDPLCDILEASSISDDYIPEFENIILLSMMLAQGEGVEITCAEDVQKYASTLGSLIITEGLARKGLIRMDYDKISFGEEYKDEPIAFKTDKFDKFVEGMDDEDDY